MANIDDFTLSELANVDKENIENILLNLTADDENYILKITHISISSIMIEFYYRYGDSNEQTSIERKRKIYEKQEKKRWSEIGFIPYDGLISFPSIGYFLPRFNIKLVKANNMATNYLKTLIEYNELKLMFREKFEINGLKRSYAFERALSKFIKDICINDISSDERLQKKLIEIEEDKERKKIEVEEHMAKLEELERKKQEFKRSFEEKRSKNANDYNIRW